MMKQNRKKISGIWFFGYSGSGKSYASNYISKKINKRIIIDGDDVRSKVSFDLGHTIKDRKIQLKRLLGISKICILSNVIPIVSSVYMTKKASQEIRKNKILLIKIERENKILKKFKIYKKKNNVVGIDIFYEKFKFKKIFNKGDSLFKKELNKLINLYKF